MKKLLLFFLFLSLIAFGESYYYTNGKKLTINKSEKFYSFEATQKIELEVLKKELSSKNLLNNIDDIKIFNNIFIIKGKNGFDLTKLSSLSIFNKELKSFTLDQEKWPMIINNTLFISFKDNFSTEIAEFFLKNHKLDIVKRYEMKNTYLVKTSDDVLTIANKIFEMGVAKYSYPNFLLMHDRRFAPNDTYYTSQWHHSSATGGANTTGAWDVNQGSSTIKIGIVDDGIKVGHEDIDILNYQDFTGETSFEYGGDHGTACAGVAAAKGNNNQGVAGVCMNCKILSAKIMSESGYGYENGDSDAILWVKNQGADVISNSWGFAQDFPIPDNLNEAINSVTSTGRSGKGCVVVFAAGNETRQFSSNSLEGHPKIIAVGASTYQDKLSYYSNYGSTLDVVAPSNTGYYDTSNNKDGIWTTDAYNTSDTAQNGRGYNRDGSMYSDGQYIGSDIPNTGKYTKGFGGTSSACPYVAGLAALILSEDSTLTYTEVYNIIISTTDKISGFDYYADEHPSSCGTYTNGHSDCFGYGRVNAKKALELTRSGGGGDVCDSVDCASMYANTHCDVDENGEAQCYCNEGYVVNSAGDACVLESAVCEGVSCPANSSCGVGSDGSAACFCDEGYVVNSAGDACVPDTCVDDNLNNNSIETSKQVSLPYTGTHHSCSSRADFFKFSLSSGSTLTVTLTNFSNDIDLYLFGSTDLSEESVLASAATEDTTETISYQVTETKTYYLLVNPYQTVDSNYTLSISSTGAVSPCNGVTCSNHGSCSIQNNSAVCICDNGYTASGLTCVANTTDPCDGVTCSNHGSCSVQNNSAVCICDTGYTASGLTCVQNTTDPCDGITCTGHGTCSVQNNLAVCICDAGYKANGLSCVEDVADPCDGITCGTYGFCTNENGVARCICDSGYHAEGYNCVIDATDPCTGITCSDKGYCGIVNTDLTCICIIGYHAEGLNCVENSTTDPCLGVTCSNNGVCLLKGDNTPFCSCRDGYEASALNCIPSQNSGGGGSSGCSFENSSSSNSIIMILLSILSSLFIFRRKLQ
ncbi:S8 family serine peptidase [bacterium]|nr:S8 family serine peptidase [bacterium]